MKAAFLLLVVLPLAAQQGVNFYSLEKERALGAQLAADIRRQAKPFENVLANDYLQRVGGRLLSRVAEPPFEYRLELVLTADATEPMPLPGGYLFVPARFFLAAEDEAEFAAVLAHSIGHIALRHGTRSATRGQLVNVASIPLVFMCGWMGSHAESGRSRVAVPLGFLSFQRAYELEADAFGLELAARAGYPPAAFRRYIDRTQAPDGQQLASPLPARDLRLARIGELVRSLTVAPSPQPSPSSPSAEFRQVQDVVRQLSAEPAQRRVPTLRR
jgi:predicted Zn-dependent protease